MVSLEAMAAGGGSVLDSVGPILARQRAMVLDGGLATTLEDLGFDTSGELWSARALTEAPELLVQVHREFLRAGADCVATATYQATLPGLVRAGHDERAALDLFRLAVELAKQAVDLAIEDPGDSREEVAGRCRPLVAASIGPYGAYLADGSEYRGDYRVGQGELVDFHRPRLRALVAAGPDVLAFETLPSAVEVVAVLELLDQERARGDLPGSWVSLQCRDERALADGTSLDEIVPRLDRHPAVLAIGVNCMSPALVPGLLRSLAALTSKALVVYPNSGERWEGKRWQGDATDWIEAAPGWLELGARLVGGCCRTGPNEIRRLRAEVLPAS